MKFSQLWKSIGVLPVIRQANQHATPRQHDDTVRFGEWVIIGLLSAPTSIALRAQIKSPKSNGAVLIKSLKCGPKPKSTPTCAAHPFKLNGAFRGCGPLNAPVH